jgi:FkbM family methyltransferase
MSHFLGSHSIRVGEIEISLPNERTLTLWGEDEDLLASRLWMLGWDSYEPEVVWPWLTLARDAKVVLDVGAHVGLFALLAGHANPASEVWAFEPLADTFRLLQRNVSLNTGVSVRCVQTAVGDRASQARLYVDPTNRYDISASFTASEGRSVGVDVRQIDLDSWAAENGVSGVDLVKIDAEGAEPQVFAGMAGILERDRPDVVVEVFSDASARAVGKIASAYGYRHFLLTPGRPVATDGVRLYDPPYPNYLLSTRSVDEVSGLTR